jgi:hypothetical protein
MRIEMKAGLLATVLVVGCGGSGGNDVLLDPPAAGQGFQLNVPKFDVAMGDEVQSCYFFAVPGPAGSDVWVDHFKLAANVGTHHLNIFRVRTVIDLGGKPGDIVVSKNGMGPCFKSSNWADWPIVANTQDGGQTIDWQLPAGVGQRFTGGELLMLQIHFVNATTQTTPAGGRGAVNFYTLSAPPANEMGTIFATNQHIRICPGDSNVSFETHCKTPLSGATIFAANGHFHSRGTSFTMNVVDAMGTDTLPAPFYTSTTWNEPPMTRDLNIKIPDGGGVSWTCNYAADSSSCGNPMDSCCFTFGGKVETQEHCNAFVYYYPKVQDYSCF